MTAMTLSESQPVSVERIGPYRVLRYLTAGGMADLYLCRDSREGPDAPPLVLKRVQTRYLGEPRVLAMFRDEAQIGRLLDHPNIVHTHEIGESGGYLYIAMEYIEGHDLIEILRTATQRRIAVPRDIGVALCAQVARALAYAHDLRDAEGRSLEIVHCDVSPGNIMISWRGAVKLVDFGVSRAKIPLYCPDRGVAGKYNYMAPEQIMGGRIDRRADLFALGVILYELTCGQRLFRGKPEAVMQQVVGHDIAPPRQVLPDYPPELEAIVVKALQRDPQKRYPTAEALRVDLAAFLSRSSKTGRAHGKRELGRFLRTVFGVPEPEAPEVHEAPDFELRISASDESPPPRSTPSAKSPLPDLLRATDLAVTPSILLRIDDEPDADISGEINVAIDRVRIDHAAPPPAIEAAAPRQDEPTHLLPLQPPGQLLAPEIHGIPALPALPALVEQAQVPARRRAGRDALLWLVPLALLVFIGLYYMVQR